MDESSSALARTALDVLGVGETMLQLTAPAGGSLEHSHHLLASTAGAESNVVSHLAHMGHRTGFATAVGDDPWGRRIVDDLRSAGVDTTSIVMDAGAPTGLYAKSRTADGTQVHYHRAGSAASRLDEDYASTVFARTPAIIHASGILPALSPGCARLAHAIANRGRRSALLSFDVNHRPGLWSAADAAPVLRLLARSSDIVFVGRDEAERLWGCTDADAVRAHLPEPIHLVVKDDDREAVEWHGHSAAALAPDLVEVREVVGAGDAFAAGWLSAFLDGCDAGGRLARAHAVAALVLTSLTDHPDEPARLAAVRVGDPARGRSIP